MSDELILTKKQAAIYRLLLAAPDGLSMQALADAIGSSINSLKVIIYKMRALGINIEHPRKTDPHVARSHEPQVYRLIPAADALRDHLIDFRDKAVTFDEEMVLIPLNVTDLDRLIDAIIVPGKLGR